MNPLISAATLLIHLFFDAYIFILLLRFILQKLNVSWYNPISRFIITVTQKPLIPFRKIIPKYDGYDFAILVLALIVQCIEDGLLLWIQMDALPHSIGLVIIIFAQLMGKLILIYTYAIIINAISSWIPSIQANPFSQIIYYMVDPMLSIFRQYIPLIAGIDISPIFALVGLTLINMVIVTPLLMEGMKLI